MYYVYMYMIILAFLCGNCNFHIMLAHDFVAEGSMTGCRSVTLPCYLDLCFVNNDSYY